jgi:hypothetical protein
MTEYYTEKECLEALNKATKTINDITNTCKEYTRGLNDCFAFFAEYDLELRGHSKARDIIKTPWKSTREWTVKLLRAGYDIESYAEYCGYNIIANRRPLTGDISFEKGAMLCKNGFWVSTNENNTGVENRRQAMFLERSIPIARPARSQP